MSTGRKIVYGVLGLAALGVAFGAGAAASGGIGPGPMAAMQVAMASDGGSGFMKARGWHRSGGHGNPMERICGDSRDAALEGMIAYGRSYLGISGDQDAAFDQLADRLRAGSERFDGACQTIDGEPETAPERLAAAEALMEAGLDTLKDARPAFDALYETLDPEQRERLDTLGPHRGRGMR